MRIEKGAGVRAISASDQLLTGTVVISGGANITVGTDAGSLITISGGADGGGNFSAGVSNLGNTSGDTGTVSNRLVLAGGNNITVSQATNAGGATITISGVNTVAQTGTQFSAGISGGNTSGDTGTVAGRLVLAGGNNITLSGSTNGASETITISGGAGAGGFAGGGISGGNTSGDTGSVTGRLIFAGNNNVTLSGSTNAGSMTISVSVPNTSSQTGTQFSGGISGGNTSGNTGTKPGLMVLAGGNNITVSGATAGDNISVTVSGANQTGTQFSGGVSNIGNTAGDTGTVGGRLVLAGGNNITLSGSTNGVSETITISGAAGGAGFAGGGISGGNTSGDTGSVTGRLIFAGGNNITLSGSTNGGSMSITVSGGAGDGGATLAATKHWPSGAHMSAMPSGPTGGNATVYLIPFQVPVNIEAHTAAQFLSISGASASTAGQSLSIGVYTENAGTLSLATSGELTSSWTSGTNNSSNWGGIFGARRWQITNQTWNFTPGDYVVALWHRSTNAGTYSWMGGSIGANAAISGIGGTATASSVGIFPWFGIYSASVTTAMPASIPGNNVSKDYPGANNGRIPDFMFWNSTWGAN